MVLFSVPFLAQTPPACVQFAPDNTIVWPAGFGDPAAFGRVVLADLNGDQAAEGVVLAGGVAVMLETVAVHDAPRHIVFPGPTPALPPTSVADIATLHGKGPGVQEELPEGGLSDVVLSDGVLMTDARGLYLVTYLGTTFQAPVVIVDYDEDYDWRNATPIHVDDLNNDGNEDVLGVSSNRRSILRLFWNGSGFTPKPTITLPYDILDVVAVNWNRSVEGEREIVALTRRGLYVYGKNSQTGEMELQQNVLYLALTGCITRIATDADCHERLAWVRSTSTTQPTSELLVIAQQTPPPPGSVFATPMQSGPWPLSLNLCGTTQPLLPIALLAGDYDENLLREDLLVVHELNQTALMLRNVGAAAGHFDPGDAADYEVIALTDSASEAGNVGLPAFEQLDDYGPEDLVFPVAASAKIEVFQGLPYTTTDPPIVIQPFTSAGIIRGEFETLYGEELPVAAAKLRFAFLVPEALDSYTHIDMTIWFQENAGAPVDESAVYHARHLLDRFAPLALPVHRYQWIDIEPPGPPTSPAPPGEVFPPGDCWSTVGDKPYFYTEFRFLKIDGTTITRSRIFAGGFTLDNCSGNDTYLHLTDAGIPNTLFELYSLYEDEIFGAATMRQLLGAFVPMSKVPHFNEEAVPIPGLLLPGAPATAYEDP